MAKPAKTTQQRFDEALKSQGVNPSKVNEDLYFEALDAFGEGGLDAAFKRLGIINESAKATELISNVATKGTVEDKVINENMNNGYSMNQSTSMDDWYSNPDINGSPHEKIPTNIISPQQLQQQVIESAVVDEVATEAAKGAASVENEINADPGKGNPNNWEAHVTALKNDILDGGLTNAAVGGGSIALSQMQGRGVVGTAANLAGALGGSMLGAKHLGDTSFGTTPARLFGGLAGHTITNLLTNLFRNPHEKQLLDQGMQYQQQVQQPNQ